MPLWKVTPLRSLNTQVRAWSLASMLSASSGAIEPSGCTSVRLLPQHQLLQISTTEPLLFSASRVSVVDPAEKPWRSRPPFFGVAARTAFGMDRAAGRATPAATAETMN